MIEARTADVQDVEALIDAGDADAAQAALDEIPPDCIPPARRWYLVGRIAVARNDLTAAEDALQQAARLAPEDPDVIVWRVDVRLRRGRKRRARLMLWRAIRRYPDEPKLWRTRGIVAYMRGKKKRAARATSRALEVAPDDLEVVDLHVAILRDLDRYDDAREVLRDAHERHADRADPLIWLGLVELDDAQLEAAAAALGRAVELAPERLDVVRLRAAAMRLLGRFSAAEAIIVDASENGELPQDAALLVELALLRFHLGRPDEAERLSRQAFELDPGNATAATNVAWLLESQGGLEDARDWLEKALAHAPSNREILVELARIERDLRDYADAARHYTAALKLRRDSETRKAARAARWRAGKIPLLAPLLRSIDRETRRRYNDVRPVLAALEELLSAPGPTRRSLRARAAHLAWRRARTRALLSRPLEATQAIPGIVLGCMFWLSPLVFDWNDGPGPEPASEYVTLGVPYVMVTALAWCAFAWLISPDRRSPFMRRLAIGAAGFSAVSVALVVARDDLPDGLVLPVLWAAVAAATSFTVMLVLVVVLVGLEGWAERRARQADPFAVAVTALAAILVRLRSRVDPLDRDAVRLIVRYLEDAAAGLQAHLRGMAPTGDLRTDAWLAERANGIAAAVRDLKGWVMTPGADTFDALRTRIETDARSIADGRWSDLPWTDPTAAAAGARRRRALVIGRQLVLGVVPLAALLALQAAGVVGSAGTEELRVLLITWSVVALAVALDPTFGDKLALLRNVRGAMDGGAKSGPAS